jgi:hypothetical protein
MVASASDRDAQSWSLTAEALSTATETGNIDLGFSYAFYGAHMKDDGTELYAIVVALSGGATYLTRYSMFTDYDADTLLQTGTAQFSGTANTPRDVWVNPDGSRAYILEDYGRVAQHDLSPAFDLGDVDAANTGDKSNAFTVGADALHLQLSPDESLVWIRHLTVGGDLRISEWKVPTPGDISSVGSASPSSYLALTTADDRGFWRGENWMVVLDYTNSLMVEYSV